jgi:hypothetical protein
MKRIFILTALPICFYLHATTEEPLVIIPAKRSVSDVAFGLFVKNEMEKNNIAQSDILELQEELRECWYQLSLEEQSDYISQAQALLQTVE